MSAKRNLAVVLALLAVLALAAPGALAKKPPEDPPPPMTNPALAYIGPEKGGRNNLYIMEADGSPTQSLTSSSRLARKAPAWSPDGSQIAYLQAQHVAQDGWDLIVINVDGTGEPVTHSFDSSPGNGPAPDRAAGLSWFPDGAKILYGTNTDFYVLDLGDLSNPDDDEVQGLEISTYHSHGAGSYAGWAGSLGPDLDADTQGYQGVICYGAASMRLPHGVVDVHVAALTEDLDGTLNIDPSTITALEQMTWNQVYPAFSPDGGQIAFEISIPYRELWVVDFDADTFTFGIAQLVLERESAGSRVSWSPDASWLAFQKRADSRAPGDLYRVRSDGTDLTQLTDSRGHEGIPDWNPAWVNDIDP